MFLQRLNHIHFIGIGGSGMSALAYFALAHGKRVSGSDSGQSLATEDLIQKGAFIFIGHHGDHIEKTVDLVIYTEAIDKKTNPEYLKAKERGLELMSYFEALGKISEEKKTIVVAGTHGKTTTTAMLGLALREAGLDPLVILGSRVPEFDNRNIYIGKGEWFVVEGCEYRRSFLNLRPFGVVLLNCEADHLDYYRDEDDYQLAFLELIGKIPKEGFLVAPGHDDNIKKVMEGLKGAFYNVEKKIDFSLKVAGEFNQWNAACALKAAEVMGAKTEMAIQALKTFTGTARRMEIKGVVRGVTIVDDYGHHPTEIRVTLQALKERFTGQRLICVFQPHQFSRTYQLLKEFGGAFKAADVVMIPNIYEARDTDEDKRKIDAERFVNYLAQTHPRVIWSKTFEGTKTLLKKETRSGDVVVIMGAGDIGALATELAKGW